MLNKLVLYIPFLYPDEKSFFEILDVLSENGIKYLELGVPVKDANMDGPLIRQAHIKVLEQGFTREKLVETLEIIRERYSFKIILMTYIEGVKKYSLNGLLEDLYDGILCVDEMIERHVNSKALQVYPPNLNEDKMDYLLENNVLFSYIISGEGKTGTFNTLPKDFIDTIKYIKSKSSLPTFVGFGIKTAEDVKEVMENGADGAIIGTEFMRRYQDGGIEGVQGYLNEFKDTFE